MRKTEVGGTLLETTLFEASNSMKPYPSVTHAHTSKLRPVKCFFEPNNLDEVSNRIPPTSRNSTSASEGGPHNNNDDNDHDHTTTTTTTTITTNDNDNNDHTNDNNI